MRIIVDSREQRALSFTRDKIVKEVIIKKLEVGDYSIKGYEDCIAIERKSPLDLFGTVGGDQLIVKTSLAEQSWPVAELHDLWWPAIPGTRPNGCDPRGFCSARCGPTAPHRAGAVGARARPPFALSVGVRLRGGTAGEVVACDI